MACILENMTAQFHPKAWRFTENGLKVSTGTKRGKAKLAQQ